MAPRALASHGRPSPLGISTELSSADSASTGSSSSSTSYYDPSPNDLTTLSSALLITADCLGTGILALPNDVHVLGLGYGLAFLVANLPINLYAGTILGWCANYVEGRLDRVVRVPTEIPMEAAGDHSGNNHDGEDTGYENEFAIGDEGDGPTHDATIQDIEAESYQSGRRQRRNKRPPPPPKPEPIHPSEVHTTDFLGLTSALCQNPSTAPVALSSSTSPGSFPRTTHWPSRAVAATYYTNLFLVLGNYILVMSHAVRSLLGEETICLPTAGVVASVLMYALAQLRTMANLGRSASWISLGCLAAVVGICLGAIGEGEVGYVEDEDKEIYSGAEEGGGEGRGRWLEDNIEGGAGEGAMDGEDIAQRSEGIESSSPNHEHSPSVARQLAAIASIGFAVGSQKLLLNIRHEMKVRDHAAPHALGLALFLYGVAYVAVCVLAGPNPPSLLFDAIDEGPVRKAAGFFLWVHVAVSYAINSQALTSSLDRIAFHRVATCGLHRRDRARWAVLTLLISLSAYLVANAIPFFRDLVALIGALTSVPLTLLLPAIFYRKVTGAPALRVASRDWRDAASYLLLVYSIVFLLCGLFGALASIGLDWENHGHPFSCD